jgi:hypothetical protein
VVAIGVEDSKEILEENVVRHAFSRSLSIEKSNVGYSTEDESTPHRRRGWRMENDRSGRSGVHVEVGIVHC